MYSNSISASTGVSEVEAPQISVTFIFAAPDPDSNPPPIGSSRNRRSGGVIIVSVGVEPTALLGLLNSLPPPLPM